MAIVVDSITPNIGITGGRERITIKGSGYDIHPFPPVQSGYIGKLDPSLTVKIDGYLCTDVQVYEDGGFSYIECSTPRYLGSWKDIPKLVDVEIENLLNPENLVVSNAFTYRKQDVTTRQNDFIYNKVLRALVLELRRQVTVNDVHTRVHKDFDGNPVDSKNEPLLTSIPYLIISGPDVKNSKAVYSQKYFVAKQADDTDAYFTPSQVKDFSFDLILVDNHQGRLMSNASILQTFVQDNVHLNIPCDENDYSKGFFEFDMMWDENVSVTQDAGWDNTVSASATIRVMGVPVDRIDGLIRTDIMQVDEINKI